MNKRAQFFILSAVIIAAIIVSITSVQNYIGTADAPKRFYYYTQQLDDETGAVVDYALYSDPTGDGTGGSKENLNKFLQMGISKTLEAYPTMELFSCSSDPSDPNNLVCQNNGTNTITVNVSSGSTITLYGSKTNLPACTIGQKNCKKSLGSLYINGERVITIKVNGTSSTYNIPLGNSSIQRGQFYFIARLNTTGGEYVSSSGDQKESLG